MQLQKHVVQPVQSYQPDHAAAIHDSTHNDYAILWRGAVIDHVTNEEEANQLVRELEGLNRAYVLEYIAAIARES